MVSGVLERLHTVINTLWKFSHKRFYKLKFSQKRKKMSTEICLRNEFRFCEVGDKCHKRHLKEVCFNIKCVSKDCNKSHQMPCRLYVYDGFCKLNSKCSSPHRRPRNLEESQEFFGDWHSYNWKRESSSTTQHNNQPSLFKTTWKSIFKELTRASQCYLISLLIFNWDHCILRARFCILI